MTVYGTGTPHAWHCQWCGKARGILANVGRTFSVLICPWCDFSHVDATTIPRENEIKDARPEDWDSHA